MLDGKPLCDRFAAAGWLPLQAGRRYRSHQHLGVIIGPDRRRHFIRYRVLRLPGALVALAEELGGLAGSRYMVEFHGGHFADPGPAAARHPG
jgi:hypothetical protein